MKKKIYMLCVAFMLLFSVVAQAQVTTMDKVEDNGALVSIIGKVDLYPFEYYDVRTKRYEGAIVEALKDISKRTGIDFVYSHAHRNLRKGDRDIPCMIVSSYVTDTRLRYAVDTVTLFTYTQYGKTVHLGLAFTNRADKEMIARIKTAAARITPAEQAGYLARVGSAQLNTGVLNLCVCLLFLLVVVGGFAIWRVQKKNHIIHRERISDAETGIGNLIYFEQAFRKIPDELRSQYTILYIIIDSNYLQAYHGDLAFNEAVKYTAGTLSDLAEAGDIVARITENGFLACILSPDGTQPQMRIRAITDKLNLFFAEADGMDKPYFHAAVYTLRDEDKNSEYLLYNLRRNCNMLAEGDKPIVFCDAKMMDSALEEKYLLEKIAAGFEKNEFKMYLQFIVDRETEQISSAEALSRWVDAQGNVISPASYIGIMEKSGRISQLDYHMFEKVCCQLHKWRDTEFDSITISCNFTRITISETEFISHICEIASRYVFDKTKLIIEITEDAIEKNHDRALKNILQCRQMGFQIAIDDMGSGYTSLVNLFEYPISEVKIDRSILLKAEKGGADLLHDMIALVHSMGMLVVCEGVETDSQREMIMKTSCDYIQGWYYSKPIAEQEAAAFVRSYRAKQ